MSKNLVFTSFIFCLLSLCVSIHPVFAETKPTLSQLNASIAKAQKYYEGLYKDLGDKGAVINEYYSGKQSLYTIRHGTIDGIFYYDYIGDATKSAKLKQFASAYGFTPNNDLHSYMWKNSDTSTVSTYSPAVYHDCTVSLPTIGNELPYHSKVCKLGAIGENVYILSTELDTLLPTMTQLQTLERGKKVDEEIVASLAMKYSQLGFGMPICLLDYCSDVASTIRTAEFGELEMRLGNMAYADTVATQLLKAQNKDGAVYFSYDKQGNLKDNKSFLYLLLDKLLGDGSIFKGKIPTNAETMNDILAFLLHYRCSVYHVGCYKTI